MTVEGCDYAFSNPSPSGLYRAGMRFAMRYIGPGSDSKHLHAGERDRIWSAGLSIVLLAEGATDDPQHGYGVGVTHARSARAAADALGAPHNIPIYFAVDRDENSATWPPAREYLRGCASVIGAQNVGVYGEYEVMVWARLAGVASWFFQTYAWSQRHWYPGNHLEQYLNGQARAGGTVDLCRARTHNYGQWLPGGAVLPEKGPDLMTTLWLVTDGQQMYWWDGTGRRRVKDLPNEAYVYLGLWGGHGPTNPDGPLKVDVRAGSINLYSAPYLTPLTTVPWSAVAALGIDYDATGAGIPGPTGEPGPPGPAGAHGIGAGDPVHIAGTVTQNLLAEPPT